MELYSYVSFSSKTSLRIICKFFRHKSITDFLDFSFEKPFYVNGSDVMGFVDTNNTYIFIPQFDYLCFNQSVIGLTYNI